MSFETISWKFVAASALMAGKAALYRLRPTRPSSEPFPEQIERQGYEGAASIGVQPAESMLGFFFDTDLTLGTSEDYVKNGMGEIIIPEVVCSVSRSKNIVQTQLAGRNGTVKEYISSGDYEISIAVGIAAIDADGRFIDAYPAEGVRQLREILDLNRSLYVKSEFLNLFGITQLVITDYSLEQMTYSNYQVVNIKALSDEDYEVFCEEN